MNIGIFGGTFDPPHIGHLRVLEESCRVFDKVLVIPNNQSPHKSHRPVDGFLRLEMLKILTSKFNNCSIETLEIEKDDLSYFSKTLAVLKTKFPQDYLTLILGEDQFATIKSGGDASGVVLPEILQIIKECNLYIEA